MSKKYMDIKDQPKTKLESWNRWANHMTSKLVSSNPKRIKIKVNEG